MINYLEWDSKFFKIKIGSIDLDVESSKLDLDLIKKQSFKLVYVFSEKEIAYLQDNHVDTKLVFKKKPDFDSTEKLSSLTIEPFSYNSHNYEDLLKLGYESGKFSRFKLDKRFSSGSFERLYKLWIDNSLNHFIADDVLIISDSSNSSKMSGFITYKITSNCCTIGLIAVDPQLQGKGVGGLLLNKIDNICKKNNIEFIQVATQIKNVNAINFYGKNGFDLFSKKFIYHLWI